MKHKFKKQLLVLLSIGSILTQSFSPALFLFPNLAFAEETVIVEPSFSITPTLTETPTPIESISPTPITENKLLNETIEIEERGAIGPDLERTEDDPISAELSEATKTEKTCLENGQEIKNSTNEDWIINTEENWSETKESVKIGIKYVFPQEKNVSLTFKCLPKEFTSSIKIKKINIAELQLPNDENYYGDYAYDITTEMKDGSFEYELTLPKQNDEYSEVVYMEDKNGDLNTVSSEKIIQEEAKVRVQGMDHFTIFLVTSAEDDVSFWPQNLNVNEIDKIKASDNKRYVNEGLWPALVKWQTEYIEFQFNGSIPSTAKINEANLIFEYRRSNSYPISLNYAGVKVWNGSGWEVISDDLWINTKNTDKKFSIPIPNKFINSFEKINNFKFRFNLTGASKSRIDYVALDFNYCGDSMVNESESCDDGNNVSGDGCDLTCNIEIDTTPPSKPTNLKLFTQDNSKQYSCGDFSPRQTLIPSWENNTEEDFDHYEYTSFNLGGAIGLNEKILYTNELQHNWIPPTDGLYGFSVRSVDELGNKSEWSLTGKSLAGSCQIFYDSTPPSVPSLTSPANNSFTNDNSPLMNWENSSDLGSGLLGYEYQVYYNCSNTSNIPGSCSGHYKHTPLITLSQLQAGSTSNGTYYWQVRAKDVLGNLSNWSDFWKVTIDTIPPVITVSDLDSAWTNQDVVVSATTNEGTLNENSHIFTQNGSFTFIATDPAGNTTSKTVTITNIDKDSPEPPVITNPTANHINKAPILNKWTKVTDISGIKEYRIEYVYDDNHNFANKPYRLTSNNFRDHSPSLNEQGGVKFRVQAIDYAGNFGDWSEWKHYYYDETAPLAPGLISPSNNSVLNGSSLTNSWSSVPDAVKYIYESYDNSLATDVRWHEEFNAPITSKTATNVADTVFWWRVKSVDPANNESQWSDLWKVTIDNVSPKVEITSPLVGALSGQVQIKGTVTDNNPHHYWLVIQDALGKTVAGPGTVNSSSSFTNKHFFDWNTNLFKNGNYTVKLEARDAANNKDSGSSDWHKVTVLNTWSISGTKFEDENGNGERDENEPGLSNWRIYLDLNENNDFDSEEPYELTDKNGNYIFEDLTAGIYYVREVLENGWTQMYPTSGVHEVSLDGEDVSEKDFGNINYGKIIVTKYRDDNNNGQQDKEEPELEDWNISLDGQYYSGTKTTNNSGQVTFDNLISSEYELSEEIKDDWNQSAITCDVEQELENEEENFSNDSNQEEDKNIFLEPGKTVNCKIGNWQNPALTISKTNDKKDLSLLPGGSVLYTIKVKASQSEVLGANVIDLLPNGFKYRKGSWTAMSDKRGDLKENLITAEPTYASPGTWDLGDISMDETVTLTMVADISSDQKGGIYRDIAWAKGNSLSEEEVLALAQKSDFNEVDINFAGTEVSVKKDERRGEPVAVTKEVASARDVLGASTSILPMTGGDVSWIRLSIFIFIVGSISVLIGIRKRKYE